MSQLLDSFADVKVLVVGDVMLDRYWWGNVNRISPEAPVPVVKVERMTLAPGGAANVAANIAGLGAQPLLVGIIGNDAEADLLPRALHSVGVSDEHLIRIPGRRTTTKTRIIAHSQQVARIDQETTAALDPEGEKSLFSEIERVASGANAVVLSDYAKGMLGENLLRQIISLANSMGVSVLVDPKGKDYSKYRSATILTPNRREASDACSLEEDDQRVVEIAGRRLLAELDLQHVLITQGEEGMTLFEKDSESHHLPTAAREVYDVTGAGDTVIAVLSVALGAGADALTAATLANLAAGIVVEQVGTTAVSLDALREALERV